MIDMYGSEVGVGDIVVTWIKEGEVCTLKHDTVEFEYEYVPTARYYKTSIKTAKRKEIK